MLPKIRTRIRSGRLRCESVRVERTEVEVGAFCRFPFYSDVAHRIAAVISRVASTRTQMQAICVSLRQPVTLCENIAEFRLCAEVIHLGPCRPSDHSARRIQYRGAMKRRPEG